MAAPPQMKDFFAPWGFQQRFFQDEMGKYKRGRDLEYFDRWGFYPGDRSGVMAAQDAAEREYAAALAELQNVQGLASGPGQEELENYFRRFASGEDAPFRPGDVESLISRVTDPGIAGARASVGRMRSSLAARGLERSGALPAFENEAFTRALLETLGKGADIRGQANQANFQARSAGAEGLSRVFQNRVNTQAGLAAQLAQLRSSKTYDPSFFSLRGARRNSGMGGLNDGLYTPPASLDRRRVGQSAPTYRVGNWRHPSTFDRGY